MRGLAPDFSSLDGTDMPMASFGGLVPDARIAEMVTFLRIYFGGQPEPVTTKEVTKIRKYLEKGGFTPAFHKKMAVTESPESMR
jgi:hypothetical protein